MDNKTIIALIVTRSIPLSDGLDALLKAIPQIDEVRIARNLENACQQVETSKAQLILIDSGLLGEDPIPVLEKVRMLSPGSQRILLVDEVQEVNLMPRYAEAILIKGSAPSAVAVIVTNLLVERGDNHEHNDSN
jgi:DNA-binding NarL/FixJ family response regulator